MIVIDAVVVAVVAFVVVVILGNDRNLVRGLKKACYGKIRAWSTSKCSYRGITSIDGKKGTEEKQLIREHQQQAQQR